MSQQDPTYEPTKKAFRETWPTGYEERFSVYQAQCGSSEEDVVSTCLAPFYDPEGVALEVGCGVGFWVQKYLIPNFKHVIALDILPPQYGPFSGLGHPKLTYIELPDRNYSCYTIQDESVDFVWSFGCLCHLSLASNREYVRNVYRVLKPGKFASLFFSNTERRVGSASIITPQCDPDRDILWCQNDWATTETMLREAGFVDIVDALPKDLNTLAIARKPM
jgi:SAM-dependent methyltransferase